MRLMHNVEIILDHIITTTKSSGYWSLICILCFCEPNSTCKNLSFLLLVWNFCVWRMIATIVTFACYLEEWEEMGGNLGKCHIDFYFFCLWKRNDKNDGNFCVWFGEKKLLQFGVVEGNWKNVIMAMCFFWWKKSGDVSFCVLEEQWWWFLHIRENW